MALETGRTAQSTANTSKYATTSINLSSPLSAIDKNLHHLFLPQIETLDMVPHAKRCGIVSHLKEDRGNGSAWMAGIGKECLVTVLDLSLADGADLTSKSPGYLCLGSMSRGSLETMPVAIEDSNADDLVLYCQDPGTYPYRLKPHTSYVSRSICFTPRFLKQLAYEHSNDTEVFLERLMEVSRTLSSPQLEAMLSRLDINTADMPSTGFRLTALMAEAVACLLEIATSEIEAERTYGTRSAKELVKNVNNIMLHHLDKPLTLESIARDLCVSRAHLAATYKKETGSGVAESLRRMRMERAVQLMEHEDRSIAEIARAVGYPRQSSFTEFFKRECGCTPAQWRKNIR